MRVLRCLFNKKKRVASFENVNFENYKSFGVLRVLKMLRAEAMRNQQKEVTDAGPRPEIDDRSDCGDWQRAAKSWMCFTEKRGVVNA